MKNTKGSKRAFLCIALAVGASVCAAEEAAAVASVVYGQAQYTVSMEGTKTVYYTPNLCNKDVSKSLPASDKLVLALDLGKQATVMSFQVAIADQLNSQQQDQIVVRVGDFKPEQGPSDNNLCSVATVNSSTLMATYQCAEPLNGTFITVTKNDGGPMNLCGFSARLSDDSAIDGPYLSAASLEATLQNNQTAVNELPVLSAKVFAAAPEPATEEGSNDAIVFGLTPETPASTDSPAPVSEESKQTPEAAPAAGSQETSPAPEQSSQSEPEATPEAAPESIPAAEESSPVEAPESEPEATPAPEAEGEQEIQGQAVLLAEQTTILPTEIIAVPVPAPGPSSALSPSTLLVLPTGEPAQVLASSAEESSVADVLVPTPAPSPVQAPLSEEVQQTVVLAAEPTEDAAPAPAPTPEDSESLTGLPVVAEIGTPEASSQILVVPVVLAPTPVPEPSSEEAEAPVEEAETPTEDAPVAEAPVAEAPVNFSRANLIAEATPTPVQTEQPQQSSSSGSSQANTQSNSGSGLSSGDKAGIAVGVIAGVALIAGITFFVIQRRR